MATVITELDIRKFKDMNQAVLPAGAILTPAAKDWAQENHLTIVIGGNPGVPSSSGDAAGKEVYLRQVVESVVRKIRQNGTPVSKEVITAIVVACLERMGCKVK